MSLVRSLSTSSLFRSRHTTYLAYLGVQSELLCWNYKRRGTTSLVDAESEGGHREIPNPCQAMDAEGEGGHREIPEPCHTMVTFGMQFPDLFEFTLKLRCRAVALPPTIVFLMLVR